MPADHRKPNQAATQSRPHPALVGKSKPALSSVTERPRHPATVVQPKRPFREAVSRPPHAATVAQSKPAFASVGERARHPATVVQPKRPFAEAVSRPPHPATLLQRRTPTPLSCPKRATVPARAECDVNEAPALASQVLLLKRNGGRKTGRGDWKQSAREAVRGLRGAGSIVISKEGDSGPYDEVYAEPQLFWRGDNRNYEAVCRTGFTTRNERNGLHDPGENSIR